MISPETYYEECRKKSLDQLKEIRERLLDDIKRFENDMVPEAEYQIVPSPYDEYMMNKEYLEKVETLIKYRHCAMLPVLTQRQANWGESGFPVYDGKVRLWIDLFFSLGLADYEFARNMQQLRGKAVEEMSVDEVLTYMTSIIRTEKYDDGVLARAIESGKLEALGYRLEKLTQLPNAEPLPDINADLDDVPVYENVGEMMRDLLTDMR